MDFATLRQRLGRRRGFDGNDARLGDFINDAYMMLCGRRNTWSWLRRARQFRVHGPETGAAAVVTNDSITVTGLAAAAQTRSGSKVKLSNGTVYRVGHVGFGVDAASDNTILYLESPYDGPTLNPASWTIYYDEYTLPSEAASVESVFLTSGGFETRVGELSLLPPHMHKMPVADRGAYPQYYSVIRRNQLPVPDPPTLTVATGGTVGFTGSTTNARYKYRVAFFNTSTGEIGPASRPSDEVSLDSSSVVTVSWVPQGDYDTVIYRTRGVATTEDIEVATYYTRTTTGIPASATPTSTDSNAASADTLLGNRYGTDTIGRQTDGRAVGTSGSSRVRLWPPPDGDYLLDVLYYLTPQELSRDDDAPLVPRAHHPIILDFAESLALSEEENHSAGAQKRAYAMEAIDRMEREDEVDPGTVIQVGRGVDYLSGDVVGGGTWPKAVTG